MAEDFINQIYEVSDLIFELKKHGFLRRQNRVITISNTKSIQDLLRSLLKLCESSTLEAMEANELRKAVGVLKDTFFQNPCFAPNYIDDTIIPLVTKAVDKIGRIDVAENGLRLVSSKSGYLTLQCERNGRFCHDIDDPMFEAWIQAIDLIDTKCFEYHICGCGLGYLPYQVWLAMEKAAKIVIYEVGNQTVEYALHYGVLDRIDENDLEIRTFDTMEALVEEYIMAHEEGVDRHFIISSWMNSMYPTEYEQVIEGLVSDDFTIKDNERLWSINANKNLLKSRHAASELQQAFPNDEWIVVAAGPSLNDNLEFIRNSKGKRTIVCVNTSLRRLIAEGVIPDLVVAVDPQPILASHLDGIEDSTAGIPLLAVICTSWNYIEKYQGPIYYCVKDDLVPYVPSEWVKGEDTWLVGGTVTNLALEAAFRFGAKKVYMVGVDYAYPGGKSYADGVAHGASEIQGDRMIRSNSGGEVSTNMTFELFRGDTERLLKVYERIPVHNLSKEGAYIAVSFTGGWWEKTDYLADVSEYAEYISRLTQERALLWTEKYYILWQMLYRLEQNGFMTSSEIREALKGLFEEIYGSFEVEIGTERTTRRGKGNLAYCFTTGHGIEHPVGEREKLSNIMAKISGGKQVLVVNTVEAFGGQRRAIEQEVFREYPEKLLGKETIRIGNREYPYYQFADYPADIRFVEEFLTFVADNPPAEVYADSEYSLVAEYVKRRMR